MSYLSLDRIRNRFKIFRVGDAFMLNREIAETVDCDDFIRMYNSIESQIEAVKKELKELKKKKEEFEPWIEKAKEMQKELAKKRKEAISKIMKDN